MTTLRSTITFVVFVLVILLFVSMTKQQHHYPLRQTNVVSVMMTTCNRINLTRTTLQTFFHLNKDIEIKRFIMVVDCFDAEFVGMIGKEFPFIQMIGSISDKIGEFRQMSNIQTAFRFIDTEYVVCLEDDWEFTQPGFVHDAINVLQYSESDIIQVIGRDMGRARPHVNKTYGWKNNMYGVLNRHGGSKGKFGSFTLNPSVFLVSKMKDYIEDFSFFSREIDVSEYLGKYEMRIAILKENRYKHIGESQSTVGHYKKKKKLI